ncbi:MAG: radical SAM protein [Planctomycetota bacterium]
MPERRFPMKIVLVRPNYDSHIITPPLGLGYLASYVKKHGIDAKIIDGLRDGLTTQALVERIVAEKPDAVGITCLTAFYTEAVTLCRLLKERKVRVILGGVHPTFLPYQTLRESHADYIVRGEGEIELLKLAENDFVHDGIPGVYSQEDAASGRTPDRKAECVQNLDDVPFPDWPQIDPNTYPRAPHGAIVKHFPIGVITSTRGCPHQCTFCASPEFYDRKIRFRSPENVVEEIKYLLDRFGVKEIHFEDDNLTFKREHVENICNLIIENGIKISWACPNGIRADRVDEDLLRLMKQSGCYYLAYGIESANPQILENAKKRETIETMEEAINIASKVGISCQGFFIFGLPGETAETMEETIRFAQKSKLSRAQFLILDVIPGSELWRTLNGHFQPNWTKKSFKEPEWVPDGLTKEQLMRAQSRAFRKFYSNPARFLRLAMSVKPTQIKYLSHRLKDYRILQVK